MGEIDILESNIAASCGSMDVVDSIMIFVFFMLFLGLVVCVYLFHSRLARPRMYNEAQIVDAR